jgi:hypothetical protein
MEKMMPSRDLQQPSVNQAEYSGEGSNLLAGRKTRVKKPIWVRASGKPKTRIKKARFYLSGPAWVPIMPKERHKAIFIAMCNLRLYHQLSVDLSLVLIREHYNPRCVDVDGNKFQFTDDEIRIEYNRAGKTGMYPTLGAADPKAKRKEARSLLRKDIQRFARKYIGEDGFCTPLSVWQAFMTFRGGVEINRSYFGRELAAVTGIRRKTPFGIPTYLGVHLIEPVVRQRKSERSENSRDRSGV